MIGDTKDVGREGDHNVTLDKDDDTEVYDDQVDGADDDASSKLEDDDADLLVVSEVTLKFENGMN